jgi:hypothetical protein
MIASLTSARHELASTADANLQKLNVVTRGGGLDGSNRNSGYVIIGGTSREAGVGTGAGRLSSDDIQQVLGISRNVEASTSTPAEDKTQEETPSFGCLV